jgi:hypothetical protein
MSEFKQTSLINNEIVQPVDNQNPVQVVDFYFSCPGKLGVECGRRIITNIKRIETIDRYCPKCGLDFSPLDSNQRINEICDIDTINGDIKKLLLSRK